MAVFAYRALTGDGARARGVVDAASAHAAWGTLRERGLYPTHLGALGPGGRPPRRARPEQRAVVVRQVAVLLGGGVSLADALAIAADTAPRPLAPALAGVREAVREGTPFAEACRRDGVLLDSSECAVVSAGEASGALAAALRDVAGDLERTAARRRTLRGLLTYPAILVVVACAVLGGLAVFVLPELARLFADRPGELPVPTRILLGAHEAALRGWWLMLAGAAVLTGGAWRWTRGPAARRRLHEASLALPVLRAIVRDAAVARFAHAAARMLRAGLPLDVALEDATAAVRNDVLRDELALVRRAIVEGRGLGAALAETRVASPALLGLVGAGEKTGGLADAFAEIAAMHDEGVDARIRAAFALLEPALVVTLALVVLGLVWAVLVPFLTYDPTGRF